MDKIGHSMRKRQYKRRENFIGGILLLSIGGLLLARQVGAGLPQWLFTWPMILIVVGLFVGVKTRFKDFGWLVLIALGTFFLIDKMQYLPLKEFFWPIVIIGAGLVLLLRTFFKRSGNIADGNADLIIDDQPHREIHDSTVGDMMEVVCIFGSTKRVILSKNFKGGEIVSIFGSSEINLTNADFSGKLVLEVVQIFGGTKLIIPPHWEVQSQTAAVFGGIEDKRAVQNTGNPEKILVLDGATIFGGVTISSY